MNNFNSYIKFLSRNKLYTFINVLGLSVSLMFVIIIANYTVNELTTDGFHENYEQIYILANEENIGTAYRIGERLKSRYPDIEKTCGVTPLSDFRTGSRYKVESLGNMFSPSILAVDTTFFDMFSFELKQGNADQVLAYKNNVVISERFAKEVFKNQNPIGQIIRIADTLSCNVSGVVEDFKNTAFAYTDMIIRIDNMNYFNPWTTSEKLNSSASTVLFLQCIEGSDITSKSDDIVEYLKTFFWLYADGIRTQVLLPQIKELYLSDLTRGTNDFILKGDKFIISILLLVGALILIFAILNYVNLTVAQTNFRAKEMSIRRLLGGTKYSIFTKIILEAMLLCAVAFGIGLFLAIVLEPYINDFIKINISVVDNISVLWGVSYIGLIILLGVISGLFPAISILQFQSIDVVKGYFTFKSKMIYSKIFITIQAVITIVFIACSITMVRQVRHMNSVDLGYNNKGIINVNVFQLSLKQKEQFRNSLKHLPFVKGVGFTQGTPFGGAHSNEFVVSDGEDPINFYIITCDIVTMEMLEIEVLKDNQVHEDGVWLNETAIMMIGANENIKSFKNKRNNNQEYVIKGVVKDFMIGNTLWGSNKLPVMFSIEKDIDPWNVLIKVDGDLINSYIEVEEIFKEVVASNDSEFIAKFLNQEIEDSYEKYNTASLIIIIFTFIAIIISALGLLAMSTYFIQQRSKEIAVRKVFGSTSAQVLKKLVWQFLHLVLIAFVIACPIIWYAMSEWLQQFPYRIDLSVWIFISAGAFTLLISFITVFWQSSIAANTNPVDSIKK